MKPHFSRLKNNRFLLSSIRSHPLMILIVFAPKQGWD
jgi:hypothetical protein